MILADVSDTIHDDSLTLLALNIEILLADVTKPRKVENFDFDLTCDVISNLQVNFFYLVWVVHVQAIERRLKFGNRSSSLGDLRGAFAPPPAERVTNQTPAVRVLRVMVLVMNLVVVLGSQCWTEKVVNHYPSYLALIETSRCFSVG